MKKNKILAMALLSTLAFSAQAQQAGNRHHKDNISGFIVDKWGKPVSGAKIVTLDKPGMTAYSDEKGRFEIFAPEKGVKLQVETSDHSRKTVETKGTEGPLTVVMGFDTQPVDLGFGIVQNISTSTVSASVVNNAEFNKRSSKDIASSLYGVGLGLTTLQNAGEYAQAAPTHYIRGLQTDNSAGPLIVVDGIERNIDNITTEEVENITVLKDAPAIALYGYKGINGVLSITTKRGKYRTREINFNYDHLINWEERRPEFADAYTYASAINEALTNDGKSVRYSENQLNAFKSGKYPYLYPNVNWIAETFKNTGATNLYNLSFRGGGTRVRYYTLLNLQLNNGFVANPKMNDGYSTQTKYSKANLRTNLDIDLTNTTKLQVNLDGILLEASRAGMSSDNIWDKIYTTPAAAFPVKLENGLWGGNSTWGSSYNTVALTEGRGYSKGHTRGLFADMQLNQDLSSLTPGLGAMVRLAYDNIVAYWENHTRSYKYGNYTVTGWDNGEPQYDSSKPWTAGSDSGLASDSKMDWQRRIFNFAAGFTYDRTFGDHQVSSLAMWNYEFRNTGGQNNTWYRQNVSLYGHYAYKSKYIADLTLTGSASNKLAPGHKWAFSPTLSAAWVLTGEEFLKNNSLINFLKLRASAGLTNRDRIPYEGYWLEIFGGGGGYPLGNDYATDGGWAEGRLPSTNSTHEKGYKYNVGIDATLFGGLNLTIEGYYNHRTDSWVYGGGKNSSVLGATSPYVNAGVYDSWGVEFGGDYIKHFGKDAYITAGVNFTLAKSKIVDILEEPKAYDYLKATGGPIAATWGYQALGFFKDQADIDNSPVQQLGGELKPGDVKYKDLNGDGVVNTLDQVRMGYSTYAPEIYYSFHIGGEWKGLGVDARFQGTGNYTAVLNTKSMYWPLINNTNISTHYYENRWTPETPNAKYPRLTAESNDNNFRTSSIWLEDRSFLKLRHVELYYKLPENLLKHTKFVKKAKLYVRGIDLLCFDHIKIADPESYGATYPLNRSVVLGLNIGF